MSGPMKDCVLYDRACIECGECYRCDLDPEKVCDNCKRCIVPDTDFLAIRIDGMLTEEERTDGDDAP